VSPPKIAAEGAVCTPAEASWCPVHGDCCCDREHDHLDHPNCPLHKPSSEHAPTSGWGEHITCPWCGMTDEETTDYPSFGEARDGAKASYVCDNCDHEAEILLSVSYSFFATKKAEGRSP
jgi:hypothetical protein